MICTKSIFVLASEKDRVKPHRTILRCPLTHIFSRSAKNGQSLTLEHHFKLFNDIRFIKTSEHGQSLAPKDHFEMFRVYFFIHTYENGQGLTSEYHLKFFVSFSEHLYEIFEDPLFSSDIWKRTEFSLKLPFEMFDNKIFIQISKNVYS